MATTTPTTDIRGASFVIDGGDGGIEVLVVDDPGTGARTFDLAPYGAADVIDEGVAAVRLDRDQAIALATALFELLTG